MADNGKQKPNGLMLRMQTSRAGGGNGSREEMRRRTAGRVYGEGLKASLSVKRSLSSEVEVEGGCDERVDPSGVG